MPLDYHLSPDSPLLRPGVIGRIYWGPALQGFGEDSVCMAQRLAWERLEPYPVSRERIQSRPVMTHDEAAALMTYAGLVWFCQRLCETPPSVII